MPGAWENGEIRLDYQPLVRLDNGTVVGVQPLLRWNHPQTGPLPHHKCIELAARIGLMAPLGRWMLHGACAQLSSWLQLLGEVTPLLHVALTPQQSHDPDLVAGVVSALEHTGLAAETLQFGVPVSALDAEPDETEDNLRVLAEMGVSLVLLGFRGVADFAYLEQLPVRTVELAPGVVRRVGQRPDGGSAVARTVPVVFELVHCYQGTVIVRGIDTHREADWWRSAGADIGQGEFLAPPASPDEIAVLLGSR